MSQCLFCEKPYQNDERHPDRPRFHHGEAFHYHESILRKCEDRTDDVAAQVRLHIMDLKKFSDIVTVEARHHGTCCDTFNAASIGLTPCKCKGWPVNSSQENLKKLCDWLGCEGELHSLDELHKQMAELAGPEWSVYG